jgi:hypothetical protein
VSLRSTILPDALCPFLCPTTFALEGLEREREGEILRREDGIPERERDEGTV